MRRKAEPTIAEYLYRRAVRGARNRKLTCDLTLDDIQTLLRRCRGVCAVSGLSFDLSPREGAAWRRPFAPSLDRINCSDGYTLDNCRVVCVAVNYAMSDWGEDVLVRIAHAIAERRGVAKTPSEIVRPRGVFARIRKTGTIVYEAKVRPVRGRPPIHVGTFTTIPKAEAAILSYFTTNAPNGHVVE